MAELGAQTKCSECEKAMAEEGLFLTCSNCKQAVCTGCGTVPAEFAVKDPEDVPFLCNTCLKNISDKAIP